MQAFYCAVTALKSFLKKLFEKRNEEISIILFDDENPHHQDNYTVKPADLFLLAGAVNLGIVLFLVLFFYLTPIGTLFFNKDNRMIRSSVNEIRTQVQMLQDSLIARDYQLRQIQQVIRENRDTVFQVETSRDWNRVHGKQTSQPESVRPMDARSIELPSLLSQQIIHSDIFSGEVIFPAGSPVSGIHSGNFDPSKGHFGVDIAARKGTDVRTIADGVIISAYWTLNSGYVLHILHPDGYATVYKHFSDIFYKAGDFIRKGDVIGKVGDTGLLAHGPHIHFELWKNGVVLDPELYITLN